MNLYSTLGKCLLKYWHSPILNIIDWTALAYAFKHGATIRIDISMGKVQLRQRDTFPGTMTVKYFNWQSKQKQPWKVLIIFITAFHYNTIHFKQMTILMLLMLQLHWVRLNMPHKGPIPGDMLHVSRTIIVSTALQNIAEQNEPSQVTDF